MVEEYIDEGDVPKRPKPPSNWDRRFDRIPEGKALVLRGVAPSSARTAVKRYIKRGKRKNLFVTVRKETDGTYVCYVVNPQKPKE